LTGVKTDIVWTIAFFCRTFKKKLK